MNSGDFSFAILFGLAFTITAKHKGIGVVSLVAMAGIFTWLEWITISAAVIGFAIFIAVLYAISVISKEE